MQNSRSMGIRGCVVAVVMVLLCITLNTQATDLFDYGDWVELAKQDNDFEGHNVPSHRYNHGCVWDAKRNQMVIFMGYFYDHRNRRPTFCDDVWAYSLEQSTWALLAKAQGPSARYGHVVAIGKRTMVQPNVGSNKATATASVAFYLSFLVQF
eukprot:m.248391 g.248391  ORF g.248391 m.248391 type:complete len:153 (+) comp15415_c1_seq2:131-589(+)